MSVEAVTRCEGPGCNSEHRQGAHVLADGWYSVSASVPAGEHGSDFCSAGCLATAATEWATRRVERLSRGDDV